MQRNTFLFAAMLASLAACGKKEAPADQTPPAAIPAPAPVAAVSGIELGRHLAANNSVAEAATVFGKRDTIYVSVVTDNAGPTSSLTAKWTFQTGQLVDSTTQALARTDSTNTTTVTEFHISKKSAWPAGKYAVEIWLDGVSAGRREFDVK
jgi:hypothetical protein